MDPLTFEDLRRDPELVDALLGQAHRERAEAIHRLIVEPIKRLFRGHAARTHLRPSRKAGGAAA